MTTLEHGDLRIVHNLCWSDMPLGWRLVLAEALGTGIVIRYISGGERQGPHKGKRGKRTPMRSTYNSEVLDWIGERGRYDGTRTR